MLMKHGASVNQEDNSGR